jgi:sulfide:quinone oxidoreductase
VTDSPLRVLIAGGGVAGLEALLALRALAGERVDLTLIAPEDEFVFRPLTVEEPYAVERMREVPMRDAAQEAGAHFVAATIDAVDPQVRAVTPSVGDRLDYDALVLALGAEAVPAVAGALTWDDRSDSELLGGLLQDIEQGYTRGVAVVIPSGPGWPLRGYELALLIKLEAASMSEDVQVTLIRPEAPPLAQFGKRAEELVAKELERAEIAVAAAEHVEVVKDHAAAVELQPSGERIEVSRVLALPILRGRPIPGIPSDGHGFIDVDEHCRVRGLEGVWAVGDCTAFAWKSGGFAAEQADVAANDIAASAGAPVEPKLFDPVLREDLAGLPAGRFLEAALAARDDRLSMHLPAGVPVLTYLRKDLAAGWRGTS